VRLWQPRFDDFNVYTASKRTEELHYMHANPVKRTRTAFARQW